MSNNENQNQKTDSVQNPFDPATLAKGLTQANINIPVYGSVFRITCDQLEEQVEFLFRNKLGMPEMDHALIYPVVDDRGGKLCEMRCVFYFDVTTPGSSITRNGNPNAAIKSVLDYAPIKGVNGEFNPSDKFIQTMSPIAVLDENGKIPIKSVQDKRICCVDVDFFLLTALYLNIDESTPYNFRILTVDAGNIRNNNFENSVISIMKYIDNSRRRGRSKGNGRKIDYRALDKAFINNSYNNNRRDY